METRQRCRRRPSSDGEEAPPEEDLRRLNRREMDATKVPRPDHHNLHHPPSPAKLEISDIEMISFQSVAYTSLRDLIPSQPHPPLPGITSPTNNSSWSELPIRNPLVKQAALAYLQPMSTPPESGHKGLLGRLRERCGCLWWLRDAVLVTLRDVFRGVTVEEYEEDDDDDDDEKIVTLFVNNCNAQYFLKARFHFDKTQFADLILIVGVTGTLSQLLVMPMLVPLLGEERLLSIGLLAGFTNVPYVVVVFTIFVFFASPCVSILHFTQKSFIAIAQTLSEMEHNHPCIIMKCAQIRSIASKQVGPLEQVS
ncbi:hypothetical protein SAY86_009915 [Trapa natans]|uniref:Uncharacterized protein n=1 Tax=Trapa natans TaxID=22666 RepID=A0AAN7QTE0_TRANT|nr:hypothetical protein SAY86_009915 [Trapa natans]